VKKPRLLAMTGRERMWFLATTASGMLTAMVAQKSIKAVYRAVRKEAPESFWDPTRVGFSWTDVVLWAGAAGVGLGVAKVLGERLATLGWEVATGSLPPGAVQEEQTA